MTGKILIADAVATNRITLKVKLGAACYQMLQAASSDEMMALIRKEKPQIVVADAGLLPGGAAAVCGLLRMVQPRPALIVLASGEERLAALRASADEVLAKPIDEQMLLARIRNLLRNVPEPTPLSLGMAEAAEPFAPAAGSILMVPPDRATGMLWKHGLFGRFSGALRMAGPEQALSEVAAGQVPDLYLIAADISGRADGLRLLSELRARPNSREAAFVIAVDLHERDMAAVALDLGAGDVLPLDFPGSALADEAVLRLNGQIARKRQADRRRREAECTRLWAMTDPLTGLRNRRFALPALERMRAEAVVSGRMMGLLALDLDHFKKINDTFGHVAGDAVLQEVGRRIERVAGSDILVARMGGEEFLIAASPTDALAPPVLAEAIRSAIEALPVPLPDTGGEGFVHVTASIGLAVAEGGELQGEGALRRLMLQADRALFSAKAAGRNRVATHQPDLAA